MLETVFTFPSHLTVGTGDVDGSSPKFRELACIPWASFYGDLAVGKFVQICHAVSHSDKTYSLLYRVTQNINSSERLVSSYFVQRMLHHHHHHHHHTGSSSSSSSSSSVLSFKMDVECQNAFLSSFKYGRETFGVLADDGGGRGAVVVYDKTGKKTGKYEFSYPNAEGANEAWAHGDQIFSFSKDGNMYRHELDKSTEMSGLSDYTLYDYDYHPVLSLDGRHLFFDVMDGEINEGIVMMTYPYTCSKMVISQDTMESLGNDCMIKQASCCGSVFLSPSSCIFTVDC